jgi:hypothetical protein
MLGITTSGNCSLGNELNSEMPQKEIMSVIRYTAVLFLMAQLVGPNDF